MAFEVKYSKLDRIIHKLAFGSLSIQFTAADIEKYVFSKTYTDINITKPIFITSLPRAGTTLILEALQKLPTLATHTYRDMPFLMAPILWNRVSATFQKQSKLRERAHGDGMQIGFDSPEAFEEILWRAFWPEKYTKNQINLWGTSDSNVDATKFIADHMKKIIFLRCNNRKKDARYISKNNGNIARLNLIKHMFPDAKILIPVRDPFEHAVSLHRQHLNFNNTHKSDAFVRRYMEDIGHYEFGEIHKPIGFPELTKWTSYWDPTSINYWVAYWIAAYNYVLEHRNIVLIISYEQTCLNPRSKLSEICEQLEIDTEGMLDDIATIFHHPPQARADLEQIDPILRENAKDLYYRLLNN